MAIKTPLSLAFRTIILLGSIGGAAHYVNNVIAEQNGVVAGILYIDEDSSAIVNKQVLYVGDTIDGVKVVNIEKFAVEFEKNGIRWKQRVREKPNSAWKEVSEPKNTHRKI